ncbi:hypothetical protein [Streptomyces sp. GS7]|uniref:hypothetical protein n=1 Tax=Streptomyces sp. GS7 TaxID=2692234 RepID=UPI001317415A|nr:hypothetical protein [Streptomyces sp. GS7]QHC26372.1 hypothetical protein GR130_38415 [Streptomyces sp. GS7]
MANDLVKRSLLSQAPRNTEWMDRDNDVTLARRPRVSVDPALRLRHLRKSYNDHVKELFAGPSHRRLVSYVIRPPGADASAVQSQLRELAETRGRHVIYDITDTTACDLRRREGYAKAISMIYAGRADGLVIPDMATITADYAHYEQQVRWLGERNAFLYLLIPEGQQ